MADLRACLREERKILYHDFSSEIISYLWSYLNYYNLDSPTYLSLSNAEDYVHSKATSRSDFSSLELFFFSKHDLNWAVFLIKYGRFFFFF